MNTANRLEKLREKKTLGWGELAELLEIKRSMLHYVRNKERNLSKKALRRLEALEREAGLFPANQDSERGIFLREIGPKKKIQIVARAKDADDLRDVIRNMKDLLKKAEIILDEINVDKGE